MQFAEMKSILRFLPLPEASPAGLFPANSTRRASVCSPPRSPAPTLPVPPDPKARLEVGVFTSRYGQSRCRSRRRSQVRDGGKTGYAAGTLWKSRGKGRATE
ncbi:hypothetical protein Dsin_013890 [Dipteronia sinensis]|uniref:Uncharacterized protein n=1 Tax=Dipteronia sinensis TaxID=43782 RepID=A0AAE0ALJ4_9ROSI|nr:hypothetical protein Dsin_013890 [Dipteronia sinensis]